MRILYIDIDSLRPDHLGCYGYDRPTSPNVDQVAAEGARFTHVYVSDAPCLPSRASLFSARFGVQNGVVSHNGPGQWMRYAGEGHFHDPRAPMWMRFLQQEGWNTVSFSGFAQRHIAWWFTAGFTEFYGNKLPGGLESADDVNDLVEPWLQEHASDDDWFLHVNYWDVHHPYRAPDEYWDRVQSGGDGPDFPDDETIKEHNRTHYGPRTARDWGPDELQNPRFRKMMEQMRKRFPRMRTDIPDREALMQFIDGADAGMAYVDDCIGRLLEILREQGVDGETAIIISSDHGESIGEQGMYFEHGNASEGTLHIPLIIRWPGVTDTPTVSDGLQYHLDLPPTVLDLLGYEVPEDWSGASFAPALRGDAWEGRDHVVCGTGIWTFQRCVRTPDHLFIRTLHSGNYNLDPASLFHMGDDPNQTNNLIDSEPHIAAHHDHLLADWWHENCSGPDSVRDPFQSMMDIGPDIYCSPELYLGYLEDEGHHQQAADLRRRRGIEIET